MIGASAVVDCKNPIVGQLERRPAMATCLPSGSAVSGANHSFTGPGLLAFSLCFATAPVWVDEGPGRPTSLQQPPGRDQTPAHGEPKRPKDGGVPPDPGMSLDQAIGRLLKDNLALRAARDEIAMADADIQAAGQPPRSSLFINVGVGGIRIRTARAHELVPRAGVETWVAGAAKRTTEAQYQNAVRLKIDKLYDAFVDLQEAELMVRFTKTHLRGMEALLKTTEELAALGTVRKEDAARLREHREASTITLIQAEAALEKARLALGNLLNLSDAETERLEVAVDLERMPGPAPPVEELIRKALDRRPDLRAYRLGLERARADWLKALVEPLSQVTLSSWPDRRDQVGPRQVGIAAARGMGFVVTLPAAVRNRGVLERAWINIGQTKTELAKVERDVILDVRKARLEYETERSVVERLRQEIIPAAREVRDSAFRRWQGGEIAMPEYLDAQSDFNDMVRQYHDAMIRLWRSMLTLNTAVGDRIMP
jgi:outer membrane protein, heavy metal efflux system